MTTLTVTSKSTGLAKTTAPVRELANRLERARQARNEKIARADADYVEAVRRAIAAVSETQDEPVVETTNESSANPAV